jgi:hypothetical protein
VYGGGGGGNHVGGWGTLMGLVGVLFWVVI